MTPRVVAIVQARMGSSRLPGKSLAPVAGKPMLAHVLGRAKQIDGVDAVVLATTTEDRDTPLTWVADDCGVRWYRGDEHDVLNRFAYAAAAEQADVVMRITGDCPLLAPDVCALVLRDYLDLQEPPVDYVSNDTTRSGYPDGMDCEVFGRTALSSANLSAPMHAPWVHGPREHVTTWIRETGISRTVMNPDRRYPRPYLYKLSVDSRGDLARIRELFGYLPDGGISFDATMCAVARHMEDYA